MGGDSERRKNGKWEGGLTVVFGSLYKDDERLQSRLHGCCKVCQ